MTQANRPTDHSVSRPDDASEQERIISLAMVIRGHLSEFVDFGITLREILSHVKEEHHPYTEARLRAAYARLSNGFEHMGYLYRLGTTVKKNKSWFGYHERHYIIRTPLN